MGVGRAMPRSIESSERCSRQHVGKQLHPSLVMRSAVLAADSKHRTTDVFGVPWCCTTQIVELAHHRYALGTHSGASPFG